MAAVEGKERKGKAARLKPKGAAPAQKQKQIPRGAALVMTTKDGYGVAQGKSRTRLFWAARLRSKARALLAPGGAQKHEGCGTRSSGQVRASPSRLRASRGAAPTSYWTRSRTMPSTRLWKPVNVPK